jgi:hypothetical protein
VIVEEGVRVADLPAGLAALEKAGGRPPVHLWNPPDCGAIDIVIAADGTWFHEGRPIRRPALVRLFASILRRDGERYVLVTPVEKLEIEVEDVPFLAVELRGEAVGTPGQALALRTNVDDWVVVGPDHPLAFADDGHGGLKPYVAVRAGLRARLTRPLLYELVELGEETPAGFGVRSRGAVFPMVAEEGRQ